MSKLNGTKAVPIISIVIPTYNRKPKLLRLIKSIQKSSLHEAQYEIIVVDNGSTDGTAEEVSKNKKVVLFVSPENLYSAGGRNKGSELARGKYIFFLDDDNILHVDALKILIDFMDHNPKIGVCAPLMLHYASKDTVWCAGGWLTDLGRPRHIGEGVKRTELTPEMLDHKLDYFPNAYMTRKDIHVDHDAVNFPHNWAEQDFCQRVMKKGYRLALVPEALDWHDIEMGKRLTRLGIDKTYDQARSRIVFRKLYYNSFKNWLYFNIVQLPVSTLVYLIAFSKQRDTSPTALLGAYIKGTVKGFKFRRA